MIDPYQVPIPICFWLNRDAHLSLAATRDYLPTGMMTKQQVKAVLDHVLTRPCERQQELAEIPLEIEAESGPSRIMQRRMNLRALDEAEPSGVANGEAVEAAFRTLRRQ